ncbi:MAG: DUF2631 domain-containing protein, partial [Jatrophihabitans sp.]|uniref:DUF2631 domain-containing protein n=1 Tax=Jatrophihabitans sp. TaxID=1932789 RepID=UPI003F818EA7
MPLKPDSERDDINVPADYAHDHPDEDPKMWGWHGEWGPFSRVGGIVVIIILVLMITATHYNNAGTVWLIIFAAMVLIALVWDQQR